MHRTLELSLCLMSAIASCSAFAAAASNSVASPAPANAQAAAAPSASAGSSAAIEAQMLAFDSVDKVAAHIVANVCAKDDAPAGSTIVIYDQASFGQLQFFEGFVANIQVLAAGYKTLIPDVPWLKRRLQELKAARDHADSAAVEGHFMRQELAERLSQNRQKMAFAATVEPFADFVSLLSAIAVSSNVETAAAITIPDSSVAVALARLLSAPAPCTGKTAYVVVYPPLFGKSSASDFAQTDVTSNLQVLQDIRELAHEFVHLQLHDVTINSDQKSLLGKSLTDIDGLYDGFINSLVQINVSSGVFGSAAVIQGYRLAKILSDSNTRVLLASVVVAGGTEHDHKTFWTALGPGDKLTYSGGLSVNVALWKSTDGSIQFADVMRYKTAFVNADGQVDSTAGR